MHKVDPKDPAKASQPTRALANVKDIVDAVLYLTQADHVSGEILYVDGGNRAAG
jgi:NAD(P)-dependent dehydrogenase (short-subunit alcohol dehydrogenase family)